MKKSFVVVLLVVAALRLQAQVMFKMAFQPKTTYTVNKDMKMSLVTDNISAQAGATPGMNMAMSTNTTATITTGIVGQAGAMSVKLTMRPNEVSMTVNGQQVPTADMSPMDAAVYGKYSTDGRLTIDSAGGNKKVEEAVKATIANMANAIQSTIKFPDHPLKPGETFILETPLALPFPGIAGGNNVSVKTTYKLLNVVNNIAIFTYTQEAVATSDPQGHSTAITITGTGDGSFDYDVSRQFYTKMDGNLNMTFESTINGVISKGKIIAVTVDKVVIAGN